jgi:hypothetical protein
MQKIIKMNGCVDHIIVVKEMKKHKELFEIEANNLSGPNFKIEEVYISLDKLRATVNDVECRVKSHMELEVERNRGEGFVVLNKLGYY